MEFSMSDTTTVSPLRQRMTEDMAARKLNQSWKELLLDLKRRGLAVAPELAVMTRA
jgi:hypothetical protein